MNKKSAETTKTKAAAVFLCGMCLITSILPYYTVTSWWPSAALEVSRPFYANFLIIIIIIIMTRRQLRSVATTLHDDRDPVPSSTPV